MAAIRAALCAAALSVVLVPASPAMAKSQRYSVTFARGVVEMKFTGQGSQGLVTHTISNAKTGAFISFDPATGKGSGKFAADAVTKAAVGTCSDSVRVARESLSIAPKGKKREELRFAPPLATKCGGPTLADLPGGQVPLVQLPRAPFSKDTIRLTIHWSGPVSADGFTGTVEMRLRLVLRRSTTAAPSP